MQTFETYTGQFKHLLVLTVYWRSDFFDPSLLALSYLVLSLRLTLTSKISSFLEPHGSALILEPHNNQSFLLQNSTPSISPTTKSFLGHHG